MPPARCQLLLLQSTWGTAVAMPENTLGTARWDGYLEFQRRPEPMLDWWRRHLS
jgi:hypothetical protein